MKGSVFKELPDLDDKYTADERAYFDRKIVENQPSLEKRFKDYQADLKTLNEYGQCVDEAARERAAVQQIAATGYVQSALNWVGNQLRAYQSGRTPLAQAIFEHNTALAVSIVEKGDFAQTTKFDIKQEEPLIDKPHFLPLGHTEFILGYRLTEKISVLHYAIFHNEIGVVRVLVENNPQLMNTEFKGLNPLNYAILLSYHYGYDRQAIALELITAGSELESEVDGLTSIKLARGLRNIALALYRKGALMQPKPPSVLNVLQYLLVNGYESTAIVLINAGADIDFTHNGRISNHVSETFGTGRSLLEFAISNDYWGLVLALVKRGVELNEARHWDDRPLYKALFYDQAEVGLAMIARSESFENSYGQYLLYTAIRRGLRSVAQALYSKVDINGAHQKRDDYQALHTQHRHLDTAISWYQPAIALDLINAGVKMPEGLTYFLHLAINTGLKDVAMLLLEKGADTRAKINIVHDRINEVNAFEFVLSLIDECNRKVNHNLNYFRKKLSDFAQMGVIICQHERKQNREVLFNNKPLLHHLIFEGGYDELAIALINNDAIDIEGVYDDMTPLHYAIRRNRTDIAVALINKGAKHDTLFKDMTPLHHAIRENNAAVALALIAKDPSIVNQQYRNQNALEHALARQQSDRDNPYSSSQNATGDNPIVTALRLKAAELQSMAVDTNNAAVAEPERRKRRKLG